MYRYPRLKVRAGGHNVQEGDQTSDHVAGAVRDLWRAKHGPKIVLDP